MPIRNDERLTPSNKIPKELRRSSRSRNQQGIRKTTPADRLPKNQCVGMARRRLRAYWITRMKSDGHQGIPDVDDPELRYSEVTELARGLGYDTDSSKLSDEIREQCRCRNLAVAGCFVCRKHGGSIKHVIEAGRGRLLELVDPALSRMTKIITKGKHEPAVVQAIKDVLDRVGIKKLEDGVNPDGGWSEDQIARMGEVLTVEELDTLIRLMRKVQNATQDDDNEGDAGVRVLIGGGPKLLPGAAAKAGIPVVTVGSKQMAEMIKANPKRARK